MSTKLILLGLLLEEGPMHGYEVRQRIKHEHMEEYADISYGAIYFALNKLAQGGFIEKLTTAQRGRRPPRDVYQITEKGKKEFLRLLRENLVKIEKRIAPLDIVIRFARALPPGELREHLQRRKELLRKELQSLEKEKAEALKSHQQESYLEIMKALFDHGLLRLESEIKWLEAVLEKLERGLL